MKQYKAVSSNDRPNKKIDEAPEAKRKYIKCKVCYVLYEYRNKDLIPMIFETKETKQTGDGGLGSSK
ncbi:unnamed protein product [Caretta caretta]